ncbi:hypothetical protein [Actinoplanes cyaneus]|nr:hypothetical protein [Actinoplanes cyaneus]MCW2139929.1 hypothetical protein [Actinoplanes cyaneus]
MIPATWIPYRRAEDDELLGYLRPVEAGPERLRVRNVDYGYEGNIGDIFVLDVPPGDVLRRR